MKSVSWVVLIPLLFLSFGVSYTILALTQPQPVSAAPEITLPPGQVKHGPVLPEQAPKAAPEEPAPAPAKTPPAPVRTPAQPTIIRLTPDDVHRQVLHDLRQQPLELRPYLRYLTTYYTAGEEEATYAQVQLANLALNSLSVRGEIRRARVVPGTHGTLLRFLITDYNRDFKRWAGVWDKAVGLHPYFQGQLQKIVTVSEEKFIEKQVYYQAQVVNNQYYPAGYYTEKTKVVTNQEVVKTVVAANPALDGTVIEEIAAHTVSQGAVLRIDWFFSNALKPPLYHDFLDIQKDEKEFQKVNAAGDKALAERFEKDRRGVVAFSGVTINNRRLDRVPTILGYYWFSTDAKTSVNAQNFMSILLDRGKKNFDASEQIFSLPNGLQGYALFNNEGVRQDFVPQNIASNKLSTNNDLTIYNGISCIVCHGSGILSFRSSLTHLLRKRTGRIDLTRDNVIDIDSPDLIQLERLRQLYNADLLKFFKQDQAQYNEAVQLATRWDGPTMADQLNQAYDYYFVKPVTLSKAARELGMLIQEARVFLRLSPRLEILGLLDIDPEPLRREQWEAAFIETSTLAQAWYAARRLHGGKR